MGFLDGFAVDAVGKYDPVYFGPMQKKQDARNRFDPYSGQPGSSAYIGMDESAYIAPYAEQLLGGINLDTRGMDKFSEEALRDGQSSATKSLIKQQKVAARSAGAEARKQAAGEAATARSALASKGGLGGGAAERVQSGAINRALETAQIARDTASKNIADIGMEDEKSRLGMLSQVPGMESQRANFKMGKAKDLFSAKESDTNRYIGELTRANAFTANNYNQAMQAWAGGKQAQATQNSGKK